MKTKLNWKIWLLIIVVLFSLISLFGLPPTFMQDGVLITSVEKNSTAFDQGLRQGQIITEIDGIIIEDLEDFSQVYITKHLTNQSEKTTIVTDEIEVILFSNSPPDITVSEIPNTNVKLGLDLAGGARALIQAKDKELSNSEINDLVAITSNRINVYGISDVKIVPVSDLEGNNFMLVEVAGATPKDLQDLIEKQGKFEAKIGNETVFIGGERDIASVCRNDATCAYIESCNPSNDGSYFCNFRFSIFLSEHAAQRHADITDDLGINTTAQGNYLDKPLDLFLDDALVDSLFISEGLKGRVTTQISISGSGQGLTQDEAYENAEYSMKELQTILITGSLPYQLEIVKLDTISPSLGKEFISSILIAGLVALLAVAIIIFIRYKKFKSSIALLITSLSEIIIILGIASLIEWNLDLPSIAGILATIGTGIDQQIIVIDEAKHDLMLSIKQRLKRAFSIILGAYFTALVALLPLLWAGAGLLKGFAVTTIIGITAGVLITRPAFTEMIKRIEKD
jgi:preprotein translocase subunit SecD